MNLNDFTSSKFLKKGDTTELGVVVTIKAVHRENVAKEGADEDIKVCLSFNEFDKPFVCNSTNAQIIAKVTGVSEDVETGWIGKEIVIYNDPNVSFGGKLIGGIRVRAKRADDKGAMAFPI